MGLFERFRKSRERSPSFTLTKKNSRLCICCDCYENKATKCNKHTTQLIDYRGCGSFVIDPRTVALARHRETLSQYIYFIVAGIEFFLRGLEKPLRKCFGVTTIGYRDKHSLLNTTHALEKLVTTMRDVGYFVSEVTFDWCGKIYHFIITGNKAVEIVVKFHHDLHPDIPFITVVNSKGLLVKLVALVLLTPVKAFPDYVSGAVQVKNQITMTYYWIDYPSDFKKTGKTLPFGSCGHDQFGEADVKFLTNMAMDGTGVVNGTLYNLGDCDCRGQYWCFEKVDASKAPYGLTSGGTPLRPYISIAANDLKEGAYFLPQVVGWPMPGTGLKHNGCVYVEDKSWSFSGNQLDFFAYRIAYYKVLDDEYDSPDVDVYSVDACPLLDYSSKLGTTGLSNGGGSPSNSSSTITSVISCPTSTIVKSVATNTQSYVTKVITTMIPVTSQVKRALPTSVHAYADDDGFVELYKRGSGAIIPSCNGYNCYPVHVLLIASTVVVGLLPLLAFLVSRTYSRFSYTPIIFGVSTLYTVSVMIYCIVALQSVGPIKIEITDSGLSKRSIFEPSYACSNHVLHYEILMGVGGLFVVIGLMMILNTLSFRKIPLLRNSPILIGLCSFVFGLTTMVLSLVVYLCYNKCFNGDSLKFLCDIAGHMFWGTAIAAIGGFAVLAIQFVVHFCSLSMYAAKFDFTKPILAAFFGVILVLGMVYIDASSCF